MRRDLPQVITIELLKGTASSLIRWTQSRLPRASAPTPFCSAGSRLTCGASGGWWLSGWKKSWESSCQNWTTNAPSRLRCGHRRKLRLQRLRYVRMVLLTCPPQQGLIGDFLSQDMLERVMGLRDEARFIEKLGSLQVCEVALEHLLWHGYGEEALERLTELMWGLDLFRALSAAAGKLGQSLGSFVYPSRDLPRIFHKDS